MNMTFNQAAECGSLYGLGVIAADDMEKVITDPDYDLNSAIWCVGTPKQCKVCLAGAVMTKTLPFDVDAFGSIAREPQHYEKKTELALLAINMLRTGHISAAYKALKIDCFVEPPKFRSHYDKFHGAKEACHFLADLRQFLPKLREYEEQIGILPNDNDQRARHKKIIDGITCAISVRNAA